jgi:hypothetical protein
MASEASRCEFTVTSGAHRGATFALSEGMLLIGSDAACDVWLSDPGLASRHLAVMTDERGVAIRALDGPVTINDQPLSGSARVTLAPGSEIALGDTGVRLRVGGEAPARPTIEPVETRVEPGKRRAPQRKQGRSRAIAASMLVGVGILAVAVATQKLRPARAATPAPAAVAGAASTDAELIDQIRDVFRTSGYEIEVTRLGPKRVRIENLDGANPRARRAADQVLADVPQVESLTFASLDATEPPADPPFYENAPAGHLSISIDGQAAYLVARDGGRYFAGSVLPSGYTVLRITSRAVQVERDGQISLFRF